LNFFYFPTFRKEALCVYGAHVQAPAAAINYTGQEAHGTPLMAATARQACCCCCCTPNEHTDQTDRWTASMRNPPPLRRGKGAYDALTIIPSKIDKRGDRIFHSNATPLLRQKTHKTFCPYLS